jgi:hypothetical protein
MKWAESETHPNTVCRTKSEAEPQTGPTPTTQNSVLKQTTCIATKKEAGSSSQPSSPPPK